MEYQLSPRVRLTPGDPVRVRRIPGLFRFVSVYVNEYDLGTYANVIGPVGGVELFRTVAVDRLRSAGRATRAQVAMSEDARALSVRAKGWRR